MIFNRKLHEKIKALEKKIESLEKSRVDEIEYGEFPRYLNSWSYIGRDSIKVDEAVKMIIKHLDIEIVKTPAKPEIISIRDKHTEVLSICSKRSAPKKKAKRRAKK